MNFKIKYKKKPEVDLGGNIDMTKVTKEHITKAEKWWLDECNEPSSNDARIKFIRETFNYFGIPEDDWNNNTFTVSKRIVLLYKYHIISNNYKNSII